MGKMSKASIEMKMLGAEPQPTVIKDAKDSEYAKVLRWYGYSASPDDAKAWLLKYAKANMPEAVPAIKEAPSWKSSITAGVIAHLLERGFTLPEQSIEFLREKVRENASYVKEEDLSPRMKVNPYAHLTRKVAGQLADLEGKIDEHLESGEKFDFYTWARAEGASPLLISKVKEFYGPLVQEAAEHKEDFKAPYAKAAVKIYQTIISDTDRIANNKKVTRKPRKSVTPTADKKVKWLKFKEKDDKLHLVSINPTKILGAKELWFYNTKNDYLGVYRAATDMGLGIKGTSIENYDEGKSFYKKVRKPQEVLAKVLGNSAKSAFDEINAKAHTVSSRINKEVILLKVKA